MKSILAFLVIFSCVYQELVDGTPFFSRIKKVVSKILPKNKSNSDQGRHADYSNVGNDNLEISIQPAELDVDGLPKGAIDFHEFFKPINDDVHKISGNDLEQKEKAEQIKAMYEKIHNAEGDTTTVEYEGKSTNVFVGQKGSPLRKKNEGESFDALKFLRNMFSKAWKFVKKYIFWIKDEKKPETSSSANNKKLEKSANLDAKGAQPKQTEMAGKVELSKSTVTPQSPKTLRMEEWDSERQSSRDLQIRKSILVPKGMDAEIVKEGGSVSPSSNTHLPNVDGQACHGTDNPATGSQRSQEGENIINFKSDDSGNLNLVDSTFDAPHQNNHEKDYMEAVAKVKAGKWNSLKSEEQAALLSLLGSNHQKKLEAGDLTEVPTQNLDEKKYLEALAAEKQRKGQASKQEQADLISILGSSQRRSNSLEATHENKNENDYVEAVTKLKDGKWKSLKNEEQAAFISLFGSQHQDKLKRGDLSEIREPLQNLNEQKYFEALTAQKQEKRHALKDGDQADLIQLLGSQNKLDDLSQAAHETEEEIKRKQKEREAEYLKTTPAKKLSQEKTDQSELVGLAHSASTLGVDKDLAGLTPEEIRERQKVIEAEYLSGTSNKEKAAEKKKEQESLIGIANNPPLVPQPAAHSDSGQVKATGDDKKGSKTAGSQLEKMAEDGTGFSMASELAAAATAAKSKGTA